MKQDKQKLINLIIIILLCINTLSIIFGYLLFKKKFREMARVFFTTAQSGSYDNSVIDIDINIPLYQYLGNNNAPVEVVIITDFECPNCADLSKELFPRIKEDYVSRNLVKISYLPFPLEKIHPKAMNAAIAGYYANENDLFWQIHNFMFENVENLDENKILAYADSIGLNPIELKNHFNSKEISKLIRDTSSVLSEKGISGTPSVVINGKLYVGFKTYNEISELIENELRNSTINVSTLEAKILIENDRDAVLFDVRTQEEYSTGFIPGSINSDFIKTKEFEGDLDLMDKNRTYLVYCKSGKRSSRAYIKMKQMGFSSLYNIIGGFDEWKETIK